MLFIERAKIHSTRLYKFIEGGNINTIAASSDKLVRRTNQATFSDLRKSGIHKAFGEFVVHTRTVAPPVLAPCCLGELKQQPQAFYLRTFIFGMSALPPKADMCGATGDVRYGPKADIATSTGFQF